MAKHQSKKTKASDWSVFAWFQNQLKLLCSETALHGYNHMVRKDYTSTERALWTVAVSSALVISIILLRYSWMFDTGAHTVSVMETTNYPVSNIPFPAVTVCNLNKISFKSALHKAEQMTRPDNMTAVELAWKFRLLLHVYGLADSNEREYYELHNILRINNLEVAQLMGEIAQPCSSLLARCMWKGTLWRCENLFQTINSTEGMCCSFNYYGRRSSSSQKQTFGNVPNEPRRVTASGLFTGLRVLMNPEIDDYHTTDVATAGVRIMIHHPYDYPNGNIEAKIILPQMVALIPIQPKETYSTNDVLSMDPWDRFCYAHNEAKLSVMRRYSFENCMVECRARRVFERCGCIPYHLPNNGTVSCCQMEDMKCILENADLYQNAVPMFNWSIMEIRDRAYTLCRCLPNCASVQYPAEMSSRLLNRSYSDTAQDFYTGIKIKDHSAVHVYYNDLVSTRFLKKVNQDWLDVLASFGGILSLFLGFSIITGFEVIYFFSIRVLFDVFCEPNNRHHKPVEQAPVACITKGAMVK
ncbi:sodium channel protein Nach-like [Wyeomyia smithii]|uniref:sodium channel protein Nach-like n=1 Tax=Wyeomyia smithii TaxID=174621 RepID=UPI002468106E|nr:sodium channel protein Nach-like [Wyeomyia smithii]